MRHKECSVETGGKVPKITTPSPTSSGTQVTPTLSACHRDTTPPCTARHHSRQTRVRAPPSQQPTTASSFVLTAVIYRRNSRSYNTTYRASTSITNPLLLAMDSFSSRGKVTKARKSTTFSSGSKTKHEQRLVARMGSVGQRPARNVEHRHAGRKDKVAKPTQKAAARARSSARRDKYEAAVV